MSQAAPIKNDRVDRVDRNRQQFTSECRVGERNHHQSGVVQAESQHDRRQPTLVVDTITVMETVKGTTSTCRIDQEGSCNTRNAYQATTHSTSAIKKNDSATRAYFQLKFRDKFIETCVENHNVKDIAKDE